MRRAARTVEAVWDDRFDPPGPADVEAESLGLVDRAVVDAALRRLPDEQRIAITLMDLCGFTAAEVAAITDAPRGIVLTRVHRGRKRLVHAGWGGASACAMTLYGRRRIPGGRAGPPCPRSVRTTPARLRALLARDQHRRTGPMLAESLRETTPALLPERIRAVATSLSRPFGHADPVRRGGSAPSSPPRPCSCCSSCLCQVPRHHNSHSRPHSRRARPSELAGLSATVHVYTTTSGRRLLVVSSPERFPGPSAPVASSLRRAGSPRSTARLCCASTSPASPGSPSVRATATPAPQAVLSASSCNPTDKGAIPATSATTGTTSGGPGGRIPRVLAVAKVSCSGMRPST